MYEIQRVMPIQKYVHLRTMNNQQSRSMLNYWTIQIGRVDSDGAIKHSDIRQSKEIKGEDTGVGSYVCLCTIVFSPLIGHPVFEVFSTILCTCEQMVLT